MESIDDKPCMAVHIDLRQSKRTIGAAVYLKSFSPLQNDYRDKRVQIMRVYEFIDNDQYSVFDSLLTQLGNVILYLPDNFDSLGKRECRKITDILTARNIEPVLLKRSFFTKTSETSVNILKLVGGVTHATNIVETETPLGFGCINSLIATQRLMDENSNDSLLDLQIGSTDCFMKMDNAAADAVNLLPKPGHQSPFSSIFGILNHCKTKMGTRLLETWIRQPLLDKTEIERRLNIVELFKNETVARSNLRDGPLKSVTDLNTVITKMTKKSAGLSEMFRLYLFVRALPGFLAMFNTVINDNNDSTNDNTLSALATLRNDFLKPLQMISEKFALYERLVEHVVDFDYLPHYRVNAKHDSELRELASEQTTLEAQAERLLHEAKSSYASFAEVKLESDPRYGFILRTTRGDDERQLRDNNKAVKVLALLKNGVHFTVPVLATIGSRYLSIQQEYSCMQQDLVKKALDTAVTYIPVIESVSAIVAELDVLLSFATAAAVAPRAYTRPIVHAMVKTSQYVDVQTATTDDNHSSIDASAGTQRVLKLVNARHPCVELMDDVQFIGNDYELLQDQSQFQIVTGPNMGGKSTYIRGLGSIVVMAQVGMLVPCDYCELTVVDSVLARVGAGDAVQKGVSTFMAEMLESSVILKSATTNSLIIIDELGRGTSTFDGFGLAWSISNYIVNHIGCFCLFATHFHELTALAQQTRGVINKHVTAHVDGDKLVMMYQVQNGACQESFGIHVATMAEFPASVIRVAKRKARQLECTSAEFYAENAEKLQKMSDSVAAFSKLPPPVVSPDSVADDSVVRYVHEMKQLFPQELLIDGAASR